MKLLIIVIHHASYCSFGTQERTEHCAWMGKHCCLKFQCQIKTLAHTLATLAGLLWFSQSLQTNAMIVPQIKPQPLPSTLSSTFFNNQNTIQHHTIWAMDSTVKPHTNRKVIKLINKLLMPLLYLHNFCPALIIMSFFSSLTGEA